MLPAKYLHQILLPAFACSLAISERIAGSLAVICLIYSLLTPQNRQAANIHIQRILIIGVVFFFIQVLALVYTKTLADGLLYLSLQALLLVFPFIYWQQPPKDDQHQELVLKAFVLGGLFTGLCCFIGSLLNYTKIGAVSWLSYSWLSGVMGFHPAYLSLYLSFVFFIIVHWLIRDWGSSVFSLKTIRLISLAFLFYLIIMLGARLVMVTFLSLLSASFLGWMYRKKRFFLALGLMVALIFTLIQSMDAFFVTRTRMNKIIGKQINTYDHNFILPINDPRGQIWESCLSAVGEMPFYGYGLGRDVDDILTKKYKEKKYNATKNIRADAHSQYFQTLLSVGYFGVFVLVILLLYPLIISWKAQHFLFGVLVLLFSIPMLTESMLITFRGLAFCSFWWSVFASQMSFTTVCVPKYRAE